MEVKIDNLTGRPLWIQLTDGRSVDLSPRVCPVTIPKRELNANTSLKRLLDLSVVRVIPEARKGLEKGLEKEVEKKTAKLSLDTEVAPKSSVEEEPKPNKKGESTGKGKK